MTQLLIASVPSLSIPPADPSVALPDRAQPSRVKIPSLCMPPPAEEAELPVIAQPLRSRDAELLMPPPLSAFPLLTVRPEMVTVPDGWFRMRKAGVLLLALRWMA